MRNIQEIWRPRFFSVPCLRALGSLLQNPAAWSPILWIGFVISCHSCFDKDIAGAGYFSVLMMVVFIERRALCEVIWLFRTFSDHCKVLAFRYLIWVDLDPFVDKKTPRVSFASVGEVSWRFFVIWVDSLTLNWTSRLAIDFNLALPCSSQTCFMV